MTDLPLPIVPRQVLERFHVAEGYDTRFAAAARLLQSLWRERRGFPVGTHTSADGVLRPMGSRLAEEQARKGHNFLTPALARLAYREAAYRETGALIQEDRFWENLLSSQPLTFNLFGQAKLDLHFGESLLKALLPDFVDKLLSVHFEHSPGRGNPALTKDGTAFDVAFRVTTPQGGRGFIGVEVKYSEALRGAVRPTNGRLDDLARSSELFIDPAAADLRSDQTAQLFAEHLLAHAAVHETKEYDQAVFLFIAPAQNRDAWAAVDRYRKHLASDSPSVAFATRTGEEIVSAMSSCGASELALRLRDRYTDFEPVHALVGEWEPYDER